MKQQQQNAQASILDRLIDDEPTVSREPVQYRFNNIRQIKSSIFRDLENLLNARRQIFVPPDAFKEVNNSLFVYGLWDFTSRNPKSGYVKQQLQLDIEKTVSLFEPRLKNVSIHVEDVELLSRGVRFRITAMIVVEPLKEPVTFDTFFDINRGEYSISE